MQISDKALLRNQAYIDGKWFDAGQRRQPGVDARVDEPGRLDRVRLHGEARADHALQPAQGAQDGRVGDAAHQLHRGLRARARAMSAVASSIGDETLAAVTASLSRTPVPTGPTSLHEALAAIEAMAELKARGLDNKLEFRGTGCHGFCEQEPSVLVEPGRIFYPRLAPTDMGRVLAAAAVGMSTSRRTAVMLLEMTTCERDQIEERLAAGARFHGFGVPFRPSDERVTALRACLERRAYRGGRYWQLMQEIEAVLNEHPQVVESAVVLHSRATQQPRLLAFAVRAAGSSLAALNLRAFLQARLPAYMLPERTELLPALPKTRSGKIIRRVLRAQEFGEPVGDLSTLMND